MPEHPQEARSAAYVWVIPGGYVIRPAENGAANYTLGKERRAT